MRFVASLLFLAFAATLGAEEVADFVKRVDAKLYSPMGHGLKDLRAVLRCPPNEQNFHELEGRRMVMYWKAPDRRVVRFETADEKPAGQMELSYLVNDAKPMLEYAVPVPFSQRNVKMAGEPSQPAQEGVTQIEIAPTAMDAGKENRVWEFDAALVPVRSRTAAQDASLSHTDMMTWEEHDGQLVLKRVLVNCATGAGTSRSEMLFDYEKVDGYWFPVKLTQDGQVLFALEEIRVDKGVDDSVFGASEPGK